MNDPTLPPIKCNTAERQCVAAAARIMGTKWTPELLYVLSSGIRRFGEIQKEVVGINPRTLSARLDELEADGIITKATFAEVPPRVEYCLTQKGKDLLPILESMAAWGSKHCAVPRC